jgi:hypothetical protein
MGYHDNRNHNDVKRSSLRQRFRHVDWAMVILIMLLAIVVVVPMTVAVWRYLS